MVLRIRVPTIGKSRFIYAVPVARYARAMTTTLLKLKLVTGKGGILLVVKQ